MVAMLVAITCTASVLVFGRVSVLRGLQTRLGPYPQLPHCFPRANWVHFHSCLTAFLAVMRPDDKSLG